MEASRPERTGRSPTGELPGGGDLGGATVLAFESRRAQELADLIRRHGGAPVVVPAMREVSVDDNSGALELLRGLDRGKVDVVVLLTGVGARALIRLGEQVLAPERLEEVLGGAVLAARGPKPVAELRKLGLAPQVRAPEPNTWRELLAALDAHGSIRGRRVAVVEYGESNAELLAGLEERGAAVDRVRVYRWAMPEDREPLRGAVSRLARGEASCVLFTNSAQVDHVMQTADELGLREAVLDSADDLLVASIGPICSEAIRRHGLPVDLEPEHPKMGHLVARLAGRPVGGASEGSPAA